MISSLGATPRVPNSSRVRALGHRRAARRSFFRYHDRIRKSCAGGAEQFLFTDNETNLQLLYGAPNQLPFVKDAFHEAIVRGNSGAVNPERMGTKAAVDYRMELAAGEARVVRLRLQQLLPGSADASRAVSGALAGNFPEEVDGEAPSTAREARALPRARDTAGFDDFDQLFAQRCEEADAFYHSLAPSCLSAEHCAIQRQALAGLLWTKRFYYYVVEQWLEAAPAQPTPPNERKTGRNARWTHLYNERVMSMPDAWEYPWYAAWDLAFHCITFALIDPQFAKSQLDAIVREWYQHPNGEIPAYEWNFSDVNPPLIGWAAWRVYKIEQRATGKGDRAFLETVFHKLLIDFTWWVNRKDSGDATFSRGAFSASIISASLTAARVSLTAPGLNRATGQAGWECFA
jgi:hypothetical protein